MKSKRPRRVFGRVFFEHEGKTYRLELHRTGLVLRKKFQRHPIAISFPALLDSVAGQRTLPLT